jgi:predicted amidohydrolase
MKVHLARWVCLEVEDNLRRLRAEARRAASAGADLVVFPELFLTGYSRQVDPEVARGVFAELSGDSAETLFVFGSISEARRNRVTVWRGGREIAAYDKVHLFEPNREHDYWDRGDRYVAFEWRGRRVGLMNCNDVRFPEQARALKLKAQCDLLVVPAWWPWRRDHVWATLLRARAIENSMWVFGCCIESSVSAGEDFAGAGNHVFSPAGEPVRTADDCSYAVELEGVPEPIVDPVSQSVDIERVVVLDT